jgi:hypothetical protein
VAIGSSGRPATAGSRGPVGRPEKLTPSGYRVSDRRRFELRAAGPYIGAESLQEIIDLAVTEFLNRLREGTPGFAETLETAERARRERAGVRTLGDAGSSKMRKS